MVHKTDISWTVKVNNPSDFFQKGDEVEAIILSINHDEKKVSLGIKQLWDDPWAGLFEKYAPGKVVDEVTVLSVVDYGAFVRIVEGIEAIIPSNEIPVGSELKVGDKLRAEVSNLDSVDRRITLSLRSVGETPAAEQHSVMSREKEGKAATLGDLLKEKLGDKLQAIAAKSAETAEEKKAEEPPAEPDAGG
jgi:small subunit ribosomal protein S1